jgi:hypothetical protein
LLLVPDQPKNLATPGFADDLERVHNAILAPLEMRPPPPYCSKH